MDRRSSAPPHKGALQMEGFIGASMAQRLTGSAVLSVLYYFHLCIETMFQDLDPELFKNLTGSFSFLDTRWRQIPGGCPTSTGKQAKPKLRIEITKSTG